MRKELIDAGNELVLNMLEAKLRKCAERANEQVTVANGLPSGVITRIANTRLLIKSTINELIVIDDMAHDIMLTATGGLDDEEE